MRSVSLRLVDLERNPLIPIGFEGENEYTTINLDCKKVFEVHPTAVPALAVTPPKGDSYPAVVVRDGDIVSWTVTDSDLVYPGTGEFQLAFVIDETTIGKTYKARTKVLDSITPSGSAPTPIQNWLTQAAAALQALPQEVSDAVVALMGAMVGVGETLDPDESVTVTYDAENNTLTIGVPKGKDGHDGQDGHTPAITANKVGKVATFYVDGVAIATISDGTDGATGTTFTPSVSEEGVISWTNDGGKQNPTPRNIKGSDGDPTALIDDTSTAQNRTWSAKKLDEEKSSLKTEINSKYTKPQTGIPASDMEEGVIPDITGKADKTVTDALQKNKAPIIIDSATGNPIVLTDGADGLPVESMKIHFLPKQDTSGGDPSPSHVCPISGWTGANVTRCGKNLFNPQSTESYWVAVNGAYNPAANAKSITLKAFAGETYTMSSSNERTTTNIICIAYYDKNDNNLSRNIQASGGKYVTATAPANTVKMIACCYTYSEAGNVQLEKSSSATEFEEYKGTNYPVTFPDGQTVYGGTLDAVNGVLTVGYRRIVADGTNVKVTGGYGSAGSEWLPAIVLSTADKGVSGYAEGNLYASYLAYKQGSVVQTTEDTVCMASSGSIIALHIGTMQGTDGSHGYSSADELKTAVNAYLEEHNLEIVYKLATPIEIPLSDIPVPVTLLGDNTIWSDANGTIELNYRADTKLFIAKQKTDIRATIAPIEDGATASQAYSAGKFFYRGGQFCKAKTSIASGATFTLNTNYQITTVADEMFALN